MKLVWCPETSAKAYIEAVRSLSNLDDTHFAELVAAMAGGWKAQLILQAHSSVSTSTALAAAVKYTHGRRIILVSEDEEAGAMTSPADVVTSAGEVEGVDFMVVDLERRDAGRVIREAVAGARGMVVVCKNAEKGRKGGAGAVVGEGMRVVRSVYLPIGRGVEILHIGVGKDRGLVVLVADVGGGLSTWIG